MNYCSHCGQPVRRGIPPGDNRERYICDNCGIVHYHNPKIVTGCIVHWQDRVLLCRRAIEPRHGLWTVPAGFMENGEATWEGAMRETLEEANARVEIEGLYFTVNLPHIDQVYMLFRARLLDLDFSPGEESLAVDLFTQDQVPWDELAFPTVRLALEQYFEDRAQGRFAPRMADIVRDENSEVGYRITPIPG
ncbi:MAG: NUDIX domain-containing protein [Gammaproteobacteria bacterium]|nr:MAG: NUDIX domain-containing protein [Gammaproteobacteria bacterium]